MTFLDIGPDGICRRVSLAEATGKPKLVAKRPGAAHHALQDPVPPKKLVFKRQRPGDVDMESDESEGGSSDEGSESESDVASEGDPRKKYGKQLRVWEWVVWLKPGDVPEAVGIQVADKLRDAKWVVGKWAFQCEKCPETGRLHLQGYTCWRKPIRGGGNRQAAGCRRWTMLRSSSAGPQGSGELRH